MGLCDIVAKTLAAGAALMLSLSSAKADELIASNVIVEAVSDSHSALYNGYRPSDSGVTNQWFRWVTKYEIEGSDEGDIEFKIYVPNDFAINWNINGLSRGIKLSSEASGEVTTDWNGDGSTNSVQGDVIEVLRVFDGLPFANDSKLRSDNYFTIEYLARMSTNSTSVVTNGFKLSDNGGSEPGWENYIIDEVEIPTTYQEPKFTLTVNSQYGTPDPGTMNDIAYGTVVT